MPRRTTTADRRWRWASPPTARSTWGNAVVTHDDLLRTLHETAARQPQPDVLLRADQSVPYGRVAELIGLVQDAGLTHIGFIAQPAR